MRIGITPPLILAPMAGYTHLFFRRFIRDLGGAGLMMSEFVSSEALSRGNLKYLDRMNISEDEGPVGLQVFGSDPGRIAQTARKAEECGAVLVDINAGCPARKIMRARSGAALMETPELLGEIVAAVKEVVKVPVTVKMRLGIDEDRMTYLEVARVVEQAGAEGLTLHPRTAIQGYRGNAVWEHIRILKENTGLWVWGNGDVQEAGDARRMFESTGCDAVMIGRGALRNPWIFREAEAVLEGGTYSGPGLRERLILFARWLDSNHCPSRMALPALIQACYGFSGSRTVRQRLNGELSRREEIPSLAILVGRLVDPSDQGEN